MVQAPGLAGFAAAALGKASEVAPGLPSLPLAMPDAILPCARCGVVKKGYLTQVEFVWKAGTDREAQKVPFLKVGMFYPREPKHLGWFVHDCPHLQEYMACSQMCAASLALSLNFQKARPENQGEGS